MYYGHYFSRSLSLRVTKHPALCVCVDDGVSLSQAKRMIDVCVCVSMNCLSLLSGFVKSITYTLTTSIQEGLPAELKHISKRRKRNQQGYP